MDSNSIPDTFSIFKKNGQYNLYKIISMFSIVVYVFLLLAESRIQSV